MAQLAREDMTVVAMVVNNHVHIVIADDDGNAGFSESGLVPPEAVNGIRGELIRRSPCLSSHTHIDPSQTTEAPKMTGDGRDARENSARTVLYCTDDTRMHTLILGDIHAISSRHM